MPIVTMPSGRKFSSKLGQSLVDAAEASGITLPYSCRSGRCSTCKCKVAGATEVLMDETGLTGEDKAEGWILACARSAASDLTLNIQDFTALNLPNTKMIPAKIDALKMLSKDILRVRLRLPPGRELKFLAGQYADVIGPSGLRRSYSFAAATEAGALEFHVRRVKGGEMSAYWFNTAQVDDLLRVNGPRGTFVLRHTPQTDVVFLATGTGIAPVKSMLEEIASLPKDQQPRTIRLYWGGRTESDLYWDPHGLLSHLHYVPTLSRASAAWQGARGYVQDAFLASDPNLNGVQVYACGSEDMIQSSRRALESNGLAAQDFFSDAFVASN